MNRTQRLTALLQEKLQPTFLKLEDQSLRHAGHREAGTGDETHYELTIESPQFTGMNKVKRHQAIYALLGAEFNVGLHALAINAYAPGERK
jgi:stress-induced morphogen